jgi:FkbM family methyltransferase
MTLRNEVRISVPHGGSGALIYYQGESEPYTNRFITSFLKRGMSFWDVGAHIGEHTLLASRRVGTTGEVHAFEPSPETFNLLAANVKSNGLHAVTLNQQAVSDACREMTFQVFDEPAISCLTPNGEDLRKPRSKQIHVATISLDFYSEGKRLPNLIKIDVEGAELSVLGGMVTLLSLEPSRAPVLIFEFSQTNTRRFGYEPTDIISFLTKFGFSIYCLSNNGIMPLDSSTEHIESAYLENNLIAAKSEPCLNLG